MVCPDQTTPSYPTRLRPSQNGALLPSHHIGDWAICWPGFHDGFRKNFSKVTLRVLGDHTRLSGVLVRGVLMLRQGIHADKRDLSILKRCWVSSSSSSSSITRHGPTRERRFPGIVPMYKALNTTSSSLGLALEYLHSRAHGRTGGSPW